MATSNKPVPLPQLNGRGLTAGPNNDSVHFLTGGAWSCFPARPARHIRPPSDPSEQFAVRRCSHCAPWFRDRGLTASTGVRGTPWGFAANPPQRQVDQSHCCETRPSSALPSCYVLLAVVGAVNPTSRAYPTPEHPGSEPVTGNTGCRVTSDLSLSRRYTHGS